MNNTKLGCIGFSVQFLLICLNSFVLVVSVAVFVVTGVLKWNSSFSKLIGINDININSDQLGAATICVQVISTLCFGLSLTGLVGACRKSRLLLIVYGSILICLFLIKCAILAVLFGFRKSIENEFKNELNTTFSQVNTIDDASCNATRALSQIFDCCGFNNASDFIDQSFVTSCCFNYNQGQPGCADTIVNDVENDALHLLIIPCLSMLAIELGVLITVPILVLRIGREPERMPLFNPAQ